MLDAGLWIGGTAAGILTLVYSLGAIPPGMQAFPGAELLQATFTERSAEVLDVVMETVGPPAALGAFTFLRRRA